VALPLLMIFGRVAGLGQDRSSPANSGPAPRPDHRLAPGPFQHAVALLFTAGLFVAVRVLPAPLSEQPLAQLLIIGLQLNVLLAIFNLVPLPPLDGSHVVEWALPNGMGHRYMAAIGPYGGFILIALVMSGALFQVLGPGSNVVIGFLYSLVG
jgi:Zn-dependent protease